MHRLHPGYVTIALIIAALISLISLATFPTWRESPLAWIILVAVAFASATNFIANFRKAFESTAAPTPVGPPNPDHLDVIKRGTSAWNDWREKNPTIKPDLRRAELKKALLSHVNLSEVLLKEATLQGADLSGADLTEADLRGANLREAELRGSIMVGADLRAAKLGGANLSGADLTEAILSGAKLSGANLSGADLTEAILSGAKLSGANLSEANLTEAIFSGADLSKANLEYAFMASTGLMDIDLGSVLGLDTAIQPPDSPSFIGIKSIFRSRGRIPEVFLRGADVPDKLIEYVQLAMGEPRASEYYSCFISHSSKDEAFVQRLYGQLRGNAVRCFYAPANLKVGEKFRERIEIEIRKSDKLLLVLSEDAINSAGVRDEVFAALEKEERRRREMIYPIRLDDAVMSTAEPWAQAIWSTRHVRDFTKWTDPGGFQQAFERLLSDLKI